MATNNSIAAAADVVVDDSTSGGARISNTTSVLLLVLDLVFSPFNVLFSLCSWFCSKVSRWFSFGKEKLPLPPGTMGWPYIGETFQLYSGNPDTFFALKKKRYGPVFKTRLLGCPCVMISNPDAAKFVLASKAHLFRPTFPASKERMLGRQAIFFQQGGYHTMLRKIVLRAFMPDAIRSRVADIDAIAAATLLSWEGLQINTYVEMKMYAYNVALQSIFGNQETRFVEELKQCYSTLEKGYNSMPINLPGTLFHKAMKARRRLGQVLVHILRSRRERDVRANDLVGCFMDSKGSLTDEQIADNIIGVIFAARDTTASVLTWVVKYLGENPSILQAVTEEQENIKRKKEGGDATLDWDDMKKMPLSCRVIKETLRVASILSYTFREAVEDVEYEGFLIPKGWKVMPLFRYIHHSPDLFPDPEKFDPSRFEVAPKPNTFMPFGNGTHCCPGNELAMLEMLVILHHLTTKYRWRFADSDVGVQLGPFALPMNGLPITFFLRENIKP